MQTKEDKGTSYLLVRELVADMYKCDGQIPCERCVNDDVVCEAGKSRTSALKHVTPQYDLSFIV